MNLLNFFFLSSVVAVNQEILLNILQQQAASNSNQNNQLNLLPPFMMMEDMGNKTSENTDLLMSMIIQGELDTSSILPLLMLEDDTLDFKSIFLMTNICLTKINLKILIIS
jgi:hypothetical protein